MHRPILPASLFKVLALALVIVVTALAQARADTYPGPALVFNAETGEVLAAERAFDPWYPASTTKLMTIFLAFEAVRSGALTFDAPVTVSQNAASEPPSRSGLRVGTQLRLQAALEMLMVKSANDIAVAVAEAVGGSEAAFVRMMNEAAARLGMTSSRFVNPHGLPDDRQVTTAHDLGLLARRLWLDFPEWRGFFSITSVTLGNHHWRNHNLLITRYPGAIGFKTGFICASGFNLV
ncbi:MAG: D-alanyl-D-alanine carboxypeptidase, partial [Hyphomicrobiaceae bacterium]|nr:D-alanyl-D-alanine carboxypeptidase [Hyphomicrobiaceae bacterium]